MEFLSPKLVRNFPKEISNFIAQAGIEAYQMSYEFLDAYGLSLTRRGKQLFPHVANALYDIRVMELAKNGEIPFKAEEKENAAMNCYHALFIGVECNFSISHVHKPENFPRNAIYRGEYASNNIEISLFPEEGEIDDTLAYAILTHGGISHHMNFARIGFPCNGKCKWAGDQLTIFDRPAIAEVKDEQPNKIAAAKPKWKKVEERLGDLLK